MHKAQASGRQDSELWQCMDAGYAPRVQSQVHNFTAFHKQVTN